MAGRIAMLALMASLPALSAPLPKLIDVYSAGSDPALPPLPSRFSYSVALFAFSPDEQWLAVILLARATQSGKTPTPDCALLLLPLQGEERRRIRIDPSPGTDLLWSPDSKSIIVQRSARGTDPIKIYNLRGELIWTGPLSGRLLGLIAPGRLLVVHDKRNASTPRFDTLDIQTRTLTPWRPPTHGRIVAIDSERGLLAMFPDTMGLKTLIVDYAAGKVIQSVKNQGQMNITDSSCHFSDSSCRYDEIDTMNPSLNVTAPRVYSRRGARPCARPRWLGISRATPCAKTSIPAKRLPSFAVSVAAVPPPLASVGPAWGLRTSTLWRTVGAAA